MIRIVLSRLARIFLRFAQRLDRNLVGAGVVVVPEHLAALRARYPGAPRHWLEAMARRVTLAEPHETSRSHVTTNPFHPAPGRESEHQKSVPASFPFGGKRSRVAAEFRGTNRSNSRPIFRYEKDVAEPLPFADYHMSARSSRAWDPAFLRFDDARKPVAAKLPEFPPINPHDGPTEPESRGRLGSSEQYLAAGFRNRPRVEPEFPQPHSPWPTLPSLLIDEVFSGLSDRDEAALLAEQVLGKWSV